jgi:hypothetical protein
MDEGGLKEILDGHKKWLASENGGEKAYLREANLRGADLGGADLREANLRGADLGGADLKWADLGGADLGEANLREANLRGADLKWADLREANLRGADLGGADLKWADLRGADLGEANLRGANLRGANLPAPTMMLFVSWGGLSDDLTKRCMLYDAYNCPERRKRFTRWKKCGECPYDDVKWQRCINFQEKKELWDNSLLKTRPWTALRLAEALIKEKCKQEEKRNEKPTQKNRI